MQEILDDNKGISTAKEMYNAKFKFHLYITSIPLYSILIFIINTPIKQSQKSIVPNMDAATAAAVVNTTTFEPSFDLIQEDDCNTLLLYLPGILIMKFEIHLFSKGIVRNAYRKLNEFCRIHERAA